ncbi:tyrosine-type recombinase/integrase [Desulfoplanes formicivorans]|uniref:Integrase family protein n=1 Tax=Desulfoplanes formicivorans TaxID=1592317 RepID=A0A194AGU0_9BACT|nr:site-specific integrase [Desulfoplanes formicivorans]GAU08425.1 integrase family protein [Desulfoplanes formicivorans]
MATVLISERVNKNDKSFVVYFRDPLSGKRKYYKTFKTKRDAVAEAARLRVMIDGREYAEMAKIKKKHQLLTFSDVGKLLCEEWDQRVRVGEIQTVTVDGYKIILKQLNKVFGNMILMDIATEKILEYRTDVAMEQTVITSNRRLFVCKQVFARALKEGAIPEDPAASIRYLNESKHKRNKYLSPQQLNKLLSACGRTYGKHYLPAMVLLGAEHGCSKQEILDLRWDDIDLENNLITFYRTKNGMERTMKMMPRMKKALLKWQKHLAHLRKRRNLVNIDASLVFGHVDGTRRKDFRNAWRKACLIAELKDFHFHDLRHTFASNIITSGGDLKDVKEMLGHRDIRSTDRYTHLSALRKEHVQNRLAEHYGW